MALGLVLIVACTPAQISDPSPTVVRSGPAPTEAAAASVAASPRLTLTPAESASPAAVVRTELGGLLRSLTAGWTPTGETLIVSQPGGLDGTLLVAVTVDPAESRSVSLVAFGPSVGWDVRRDGSAFAIALSTTPTSSRVAVWEPRTGAARWATPDEPGVQHGMPVWSTDGRTIYYAALRAPEDLGFFRVGADGGQPARVKPPEDFGGEIKGLTPDGRGLIWSRYRAGGSTDVLDLVTGKNTSLRPDTASTPAAWRSAQPRALVITGNCCAGRRGTLVVWDDETGASRAIYGSELTPQEAVGMADWDPEAKRIVVIVYDTTISLDRAGPLVTMDEGGGSRATIAGTEGAGDVRWLRAGIVYLKGTDDAGAELWLVPPGGTPGRIFSGGYLGAWKVVSP